MIRLIRKNWNRYFGATGMILNYQGFTKRSPEFRSSIVSATNLEIQLQVLAAECKVVPLPELIQAQQQQRLRKKMVALLFDAAYYDDIEIAIVALKRNKLPACFLLTESILAGEPISWEDELERLVLYSRHLPPIVSLRFGDEKFSFDVSRETVLTDNIRAQYNQIGDAGKTPPLRIQLYQQLQERIRKCNRDEKLALLGNLRNLTSIVSRDPKIYLAATAEQLIRIETDPAFLVGIQIPLGDDLNTDTITSMNLQLKNITGKLTNILSVESPGLPVEKMADLKSRGFEIVLSNEEMALRQGLELNAPGRFIMKNFNLYAFRKNLQQWSKRTQS